MHVRPPDAERPPDAKVSADFEELDKQDRELEEHIAYIRNHFQLFNGVGPRQVFFRIVVKLLDNINMGEQRFDVTMDLHLQWMLSEEDARMWVKKRMESMESESKSMSAPMDKDGKVATWTPPEVELPGTATDASVRVHRHDIDLLGDLLVGTCIQTIKGTFAEPMELENFPFDCQPLRVRLTFPIADGEVQIHPGIPAAGNNDIVTMTQDWSLLTEYKIHAPIVAISRTKAQSCGLAGALGLNAVGKHVQQIVLQLQVSRLWWGYVYRVVITLAMVSASAALGYWIPPTELANRLAYLGTIFLTAINFQNVVSDMLPRLGYTTLIDTYILHTSVFVFLGMCFMSFTFLLTQEVGAETEEDDGTAETVDTSCKAVMCVLWLAMHALFAVRAAYARLYSERPKLHSFFEAERQRSCCGERQQLPLAAKSVYQVERDAESRVQDVVFLGTAECSQDASLRKAKGRRDSCQTDWAGVWYSGDFYGSAGSGLYVAVFAQMFMNGSSQLVARTIHWCSVPQDGVRNVPCGQSPWQTIDGIPEVHGDAKKCQVRWEQLGAEEWCPHDAKFEVRAVSRHCLKFSAPDHPDITFHRHGASRLSKSSTACEAEAKCQR